MSAIPNAQSGRDWMDALLQSQGGVQFNLAWIMFSIGQLGAIGQVAGGDRVRELCEQLGADIDDLVGAVAAFEKCARDMVENARVNA